MYQTCRANSPANFLLSHAMFSVIHFCYDGTSFPFPDNVTLNIDGVLYLRVQDPYKASYGVEDPEFAITQLAQTTMRSEIGKIALDTLFRERDNLNTAIVIAINQVR